MPAPHAQAPPVTVGAALAALRARELTSAELTAALWQWAQAAAALGAFIAADPDRARAAAEQADAERPGRASARDASRAGSLHGVPLVVKDNIDVAGLPTTAGTPALRNVVPAVDAPVVGRLRAAGALVTAKTNLHELAFGVTGDNAAFGPARNVTDPARFAGGSSSGTAVAIACGAALAGLGTDTGGSVRIPAALNGLCGLRPTVGRYPAGGVVTLSWTMDTVGPIARTVEDLCALDAVLAAGTAAAEPVRPQDVRLGVPDAGMLEGVASDVRELFDRALVALRAAGVGIVDVPVGGLPATARSLDAAIARYEARVSLERHLRRNVPTLSLHALAAATASADVRRVLTDTIVPDAPHAVAEADYRRALAARVTVRAQLAQLFADWRIDALAFPTTPAVAQPLPAGDTVVIDGERRPTFQTFISNTILASVAGLPGLTVPMGTVPAGLPAGLELDGPTGSDRRLLAVGRTLQPMLPQPSASPRP